MTCPKKEKIVKIEVIEDFDDYVYDLEVDNVHTFMANDIFVHNTDSVFLLKNKFEGTTEEMDKNFYSYYKEDLFSKFNLENFSEIEFENKLTEKLEKHKYFCVFEWEKTFESAIVVAKKRYYYLQDDKVNTKGGAFMKKDTNKLAAELQKELCEDILRKRFNKKKWLDKMKSYKELCFNYKLPTKYLVFWTSYTRHHSSFGNQEKQLK